MFIYKFKKKIFRLKQQTALLSCENTNTTIHNEMPVDVLLYTLYTIHWTVISLNRVIDYFGLVFLIFPPTLVFLMRTTLRLRPFLYALTT